MENNTQPLATCDDCGAGIFDRYEGYRYVIFDLFEKTVLETATKCAKCAL